MRHTVRVLVVDDEVSARTTLADLLRDRGYEVEMAADAFKALGKFESFAPQVVVTDMQMPGMDGIELVRRIRSSSAPAEVIVMTAFGDVERAVEAIRAGAAEYLTKPLDFDALIQVLDRTFARHELTAELRRPSPRGALGSLVGSSPAMQRIFEKIEQVASTRATVLVTGEPGTGKASIANALRLLSPRANRPLIKLRCSGLTEVQLEADLFGVTVPREGKVAPASGATLYFDEVAELPPASQNKLLRFLEEQPNRVDARAIAGTSRDLAQEVALGRFREDLYYKLRVIPIAVPPLRERATDIPQLAKVFIRKYAVANTKLIEGPSPDALETLVAYGWPGNVRELENAMEHAVVMSRDSIIEAGALPDEVRAGTGGAPRHPRIPGSSMADIEKYAILQTLHATGGSTSKTAEILGISTRTVQYRLHCYSEAERTGSDVVRKRSS